MDASSLDTYFCVIVKASRQELDERLDEIQIRFKIKSSLFLNFEYEIKTFKVETWYQSLI